jgi:hypothetical protein
MARIAVRVDDFEDGALPAVCVATGQPSDGWYRTRATYKPSWPVVFIVLGPIGWIVMLVVAAGLERHVDGHLPFTREEYERQRAARRRFTQLAIEVVTAAVVALAVLVWLGNPIVGLVLAVFGLVLGGGFAVLGSQPHGSVRVRLARNGRSVDVVNASTAFVVRCREQQARHQAARRRAVSGGLS